MHPDLLALNEWEQSIHEALTVAQWPDVVQVVWQGWQDLPATPLSLSALMAALLHLGAGQTASEVLSYASLLHPAEPAWRNMPLSIAQYPDGSLAPFLAWWANLRQKPTVTVALMVRDEMTSIEACLRSVLALADEVLIHDTGSTDGTPDLIRHAFPSAKIEVVPWLDDFSVIRNGLIEQAQGDWLLMVDGDEILDGLGQDYLKHFFVWQPMGATVFGLKVGESLRATAWMRRLFPRHPALRFYGPIHEQLGRTDPRWLWQINLPYVWLQNHTGRSAHRQQWRQQQEWDLLQQVMVQQPTPYLRYQHALVAWQRQQMSPTQLVQALTAALDETLQWLEHPPNEAWQGVPIADVQALLEHVKQSCLDVAAAEAMARYPIQFRISGYPL